VSGARRAGGMALVALGGLAGSTVLARTGEVSEVERQAFGVVNGLPHALHPPIYVVMQCGSLGAVFAVAGAARAARRPRLARTVLVVGTGTWGAAKAVKRCVGRGRPARHVDEVEIRGAEASGLGFPSGHAAVAVCLAVLAAPALPPANRPVAWAAAGTVGLARIYVGAHLPLDVLGGAALGVVTGAVGRMTLEGRRRS
jgi:membrane-associated phospholipid phosphatase